MNWIEKTCELLVNLPEVKLNWKWKRKRKTTKPEVAALVILATRVSISTFESKYCLRKFPFTQVHARFSLTRPCIHATTHFGLCFPQDLCHFGFVSFCCSYHHYFVVKYLCCIELPCNVGWQCAWTFHLLNVISVICNTHTHMESYCHKNEWVEIA